MSEAVLIALIMSAATLLGVLGAAVRYIVSLIIDAYKQQTQVTIESKNRDLEAKDHLIDRLEDQLEEQTGLIRDLRSHLRALGEPV